MIIQMLLSLLRRHRIQNKQQKQTQKHIKECSFPKEYVKNADFFKPILNKIIANANNEQNTILQQHTFQV